MRLHAQSYPRPISLIDPALLITPSLKEASLPESDIPTVRGWHEEFIVDAMCRTRLPNEALEREELDRRIRIESHRVDALGLLHQVRRWT